MGHLIRIEWIAEYAFLRFNALHLDFNARRATALMEQTFDYEDYWSTKVEVIDKLACLLLIHFSMATMISRTSIFVLIAYGS